MIVCNASPLIALANLDRLDLLDRLFNEWCVPERVASECSVDQKPCLVRIGRLSKTIGRLSVD